MEDFHCEYHMFMWISKDNEYIENLNVLPGEVGMYITCIGEYLKTMNIMKI